MKQIWKIAGQSIRPGERLETYIAVEGTKEVMPVTFINGKGRRENGAAYLRNPRRRV